jgi:hypothetical protein
MTLPTPWGLDLDGWFTQLDGEGFRTGVRERLQVQTLFVRLHARDQLPPTLAQALALAAPLLCASAEQQRRYHQLLEAFASKRGETRPGEGQRSWRLAALLAALALSAGLLVWQRWPPPPPSPFVSPAPMAGDTNQSHTAQVQVPGMYVPPQPLPVEGGGVDALELRLARIAFTLAALAVGLAILWFTKVERRRRAVLREQRVNEDVEHHFFREREPLKLAPHVALLRPVSIALRQRIAGETLVIDVPGTLKATAEALGSLTTRWRQVRRTPEYVAMVDTRHPFDLLAAYGHELIGSLTRLGVVLHVYAFEGSPGAGCWVHGAVGNDEPVTKRRIPFHVLASRHQSHRLLLISEASTAVPSVRGELQPWLAASKTFAERMWLTPRPLAAWDAAEFALDEEGFLVLPLQESALPTLASWLTSGRLTMEQSPDDPCSYPLLLTGSTFEWVNRADAPPDEHVQELLLQLRWMLGGARFQWLCACAAFPELTPALTCGFGKLMLQDESTVRRGVPVLAALPWFRYGRMPAWLRTRLLAQLAPELRLRLVQNVRERLDRALTGNDGPVIADISTRQRRLQALRERVGPLQDVVLADFLRTNEELSADDQELSKSTSQQLLGADVWRRWEWPVVPLTVGLALVGLAGVVWTPWGEAPFKSTTRMSEVSRISLARAVNGSDRPDTFAQPLALVRMVPLSEKEIFVSAPGRWRLVVRFHGSEPTVIPLQSGDAAGMLGQMAPLATSSTNGDKLAFKEGELSYISAAGIVVPLTADGLVKAAGFTPSGSRILALTDRGVLHAWGAPWPGQSVSVVDCEGEIGDAISLARRLATELPASGLQGVSVVAYEGSLWRAFTGISPPRAEQILAWESAPFVEALTLKVRELTSKPYGASLVRGRDSSEHLPTAAVGVCPVQVPSVPLTAVGVSGLVEQMFFWKRPERLAATELLRSVRSFDDASVPLAVRLALEAEEANSPTDAQLDGVVNTLVLLKFVEINSLLQHRVQVHQLLDLAAGNGPQTLKHVQEVRQRLEAAEKAAGIPPSK